MKRVQPAYDFWNYAVNSDDDNDSDDNGNDGDDVDDNNVC